jgi:amidophosphoribosyltransferase
MKGTGGIACAIGQSNAAEIVSDCLELQPNRGVDALGIVSEDRGTFFEQRRIPALGEDFYGLDFSEALPGETALGFNTDLADVSLIDSSEIQPLVASGGSRFGTMVIVQCGSSSNGNDNLKKIFERKAVTMSLTNLEGFLHQITLSHKKDIEEAIISVLKEYPVMQPVIILTSDRVFVIGSLYGLHALSMARLGSGHLICSENVVFDYLSAEYIRDIRPGELLIFEKDKEEFRSVFYAEKEEHFCICNCLYMGDPRTKHAKIFHETFRERLGEMLCLENPQISGDFVLPILNSGKNQSDKFSKVSGIPAESYLLRSSRHWRTKKNMPYSKSLHYESVAWKSYRKYHLRKDKICKRSPIVIDCIMRTGTGMRVINDRLRQAGSGWITTCFASPPVVTPCPFDKMLHPGKNFLAFTNFKKESRVREILHTDELYFLSIEGLEYIVETTYGSKMCTGCLLGGKLPE